MSKNLQVLLANRPTGWVQESDFRLVESPMPKPGPGQLLAKDPLAIAGSLHARTDGHGEVLREAGRDR